MPWQKQFDVDEVLDKAMHAFWSRGYEATSMQDLVSRTGVNRASLYATYRDKHELFLAALRMYDDRLRDRRLSDLEARHAPREAIRQLLLAFALPVSQKGGNRGCFLTNTALELAAHDREAGRIVARAQKEIEAFFARMIRNGKVTGEIPPHVKPGETASGLLASLIGLAVLTRSRPERRLLQTIVDEAMRRLT
ncbi:MAG: TetR/AcrR family transcriptional regulator [Acidobacteria bacterium]|nr:TetR/AcrR family transcriptional regulator [Acidobacteriota bacterium]